MTFAFRHIGRTYLWVCIIAVGLVVLPIAFYVGRFFVGLVTLPISIIINVVRGNYGEALYQLLVAGGLAFVIYKYLDRIIHAAGWVYAVTGSVMKTAFNTNRSNLPARGEEHMSDDSLDPIKSLAKPLVSLEESDDNLLTTAGNRIKAKWRVKTLEEQTKVLQAQTNFVSAEGTLAHSLLARAETKVELKQENVGKRLKNKQAEIDIHVDEVENKATDQRIKNLETKERLRETEERLTKSPQQQDEAEFQKKRTVRLVDARDDAFEGFEFEAAKKIELAKQYVQMRKQIAEDKALDDDVRAELLDTLKQQYEAQLKTAAKKQSA